MYMYDISYKATVVLQIQLPSNDKVPKGVLKKGEKTPPKSVLAALAANMSWSRHGRRILVANSVHMLQLAIAMLVLQDAQGEAASEAKLPRPGGKSVHMLQLAIVMQGLHYAQGEAASEAKLPCPGGKSVHMLQLAIAMQVLQNAIERGHNYPAQAACLTVQSIPNG